MSSKFVCLSILWLTAVGCGEQITIDPIEIMPNLPQPYHMRDWKQTALDFDAFAFDTEKKGEHLPLIWFDPRKHDFDVPTFALPAYVGHYAKATNQWDTITCLGAVSGALLVGIDKTDQNGHNWVAMCQNYFSQSNGQNLYLNNVPGQTGQTFWYELVPSLLFYRIHDRRPNIGQMNEHFLITAARWYDACVAMGGSVEPYRVPDFNHTAFNFSTMKPIDNGVWKEADAASAIAWIQYMAYVKTGDKKYLTAARWGLDFLQNLPSNPYYEMLMPHGPMVAARMNAEQGTDYDVKRFITWCMDGTNWRKWGISHGKWGDYDCSGLASTTIPKEDYAFAMNTFDLAGNLVPLVRYDDRFARAIGKWMLNAANASRMFYPNALDKAHQTDWEWSRKYDPTSCIAYEGLQGCIKTFDRAASETSATGTSVSGTFKETIFSDGKVQILKEQAQNGSFTLNHTWQIPLVSRTGQVLVVKGRTHAETVHPGFKFYTRLDAQGDYKEVFTMPPVSADKTLWIELPPSAGILSVKVESVSNKETPAELLIDDLYVRGTGTTCPYATGDPRELGWGATNLGLYGSAFVGIFGAIIRTTDVEGILQLDLLATDYYRDKAYPTYLYYNPYPAAKTVTINLPAGSHDLYNAAANQVLVKNAVGKTKLDLPADSAAVIVIAPANGKQRIENGKLWINDVIVDHRK